MEWILALLVAAGAGGVGLTVWRGASARRTEQTQRAEDLTVAQTMADEDTTLLGEQLQRLGVDSPVAGMDEATRLDYQTALDAYESAKRAVPRLRSADEVSTVVDTLTTGRYALACVRARLAGEPLPTRRTPCFFNPQHGPATSDVLWTAPGRGTRTVPACAQDAVRVKNGEQPAVRQVQIGDTNWPYWDAGSAFLPYGRTWFNAGVMEADFSHGIQPGGGGGLYGR
jgi:type II secretory pathway pseudopilin PulG